ncbi:MAG: hypothetical protein ABL879_02005 [Devosia sp.]
MGRSIMSTGSTSRTKFEAPLDTKFVGSIDGRFVLADRVVGAGVDASHAGRSQSITAHELIVASPVPVTIGERFVSSFGRLGKINGTVARPVDGGFVVAISATEIERKSLAATINWLKKRHARQAEDHRSAARTKTRSERCIVRWPDAELSAELFDISTSGASLKADSLPPLATVVHIGRVEAQVVRHMEGRFGVRFATTQTLSTVIADLIAAADPGEVKL